MNATNLRLTLAREIMSTNDESVLKQIKEILHPEKRTLYFTDKLRQRIDHGLQQIRNGEMKEDEVLQKELDEWLEK